jgi:hypothetical protein
MKGAQMTKAERLRLLTNTPVIHETKEERNEKLFGPLAGTVVTLKRAPVLQK